MQNPDPSQQSPQTPYSAPASGAPMPIVGADKKIPAAICGILLGAFGVHKFILGYTNTGIIMLAVTLLTFGIGAVIMSVVGLIEGIIYLTKTDQQFVDEYVIGQKHWF